MSPQSTPANASTLPLAILNNLLRSTLAALPHAPDAAPEDIAAQREAARIAVLSLRPRNATEADLAGRIVAAHHTSMDCFRRAALPDLPEQKISRMIRDAIALSRMHTGLLRDLQRLQSISDPAQASEAASPVPPNRHDPRNRPPPRARRCLSQRHARPCIRRSSPRRPPAPWRRSCCRRSPPRPSSRACRRCRRRRRARPERNAPMPSEPGTARWRFAMQEPHAT